MGDRYFLTVSCPQCGWTQDEVYYAPTCGFTVWNCSVCGVIVDLEKLTGISYADASNLEQIKEIVRKVEGS